MNIHEATLPCQASPRGPARKDFGMINEWSPYPDMLLAAWKMNEFIPHFSSNIFRNGRRCDQRVGVLGYTFKMDTDDIRDSLAPKLVRYIDRELPLEIRISDHNLVTQFPALHRVELPADEACTGVDCVFVATNHTGYSEVLCRLAERVLIHGLSTYGTSGARTVSSTRRVPWQEKVSHGTTSRHVR